MSNLKYLTLEELKEARTDCLKYQRKLRNRIKRDKSTLSGQEVRLVWIKTYIKEKETNK